jgi:hypothetical protein
LRVSRGITSNMNSSRRSGSSVGSLVAGSS